MFINFGFCENVLNKKGSIEGKVWLLIDVFFVIIEEDKFIIWEGYGGGVFLSGSWWYIFVYSYLF